ncbi:MAG: hypothetical protein R3300_17115 [Candidatus Promineifilaceae bacterium]|nr:hypothetical protein [Candidatus Promineifilaceae bacterium]
MPTVNLILDALSARPTPNAPATYVEDKFRKSQRRLVDMLQTRMGDQPDASSMLRKYLESPDIWADHLAQALHRTDAVEDPEIQGAAREVLRYAEAVDPAQEAEDADLPSTLPGVIEE